MTYKQKILIIEDEKNIITFLSGIFRVNGYDTLIANTGTQGLSMISSYCPDLVILDLGLPDMDGIDLLRELRKWSQVPVIVVSARFHERDKVEALDQGADDYITKPFGSSELLARIRTQLRHSLTGQTNDILLHNGQIRTGGLLIDLINHVITVDGEEVHLTQNEYRIVSLLGRNLGKVMTYESILKDLWGPTVGTNNQALRVHMANIRRKIEKNPAEPRYILTEVGVGYRMIEEA